MSLLKRKRIEDWFPAKGRALSRLPSSKRNAGPPNAATSSSMKAEELSNISVPVPGLEILDEFITAEEEQSLLSFLYSPNCEWRTDLKRRCMHFGGTYCLYTPRTTKSKGVETKASVASKPEVLQAPPMPPELTWLLNRFVSSGVFKEDQIPQYCIVNEYVEAQGISPHVENFQFGEPVVGLSLLSPVGMQFHELAKADGGSVRSGKAALAEKTGCREEVLLKGRSLCVMRGESRWKWQHEIRRSGKGRGAGWKRVSLTFRWKKESGI